MSIFFASRPHRRGTPVLVAVLLLALLVTAVLAYNAQHAGRSHRETAEQALHEYAAFAAFLYAREAKPHVVEAVQFELHPVEDPSVLWVKGELSSPAVLEEVARELRYKKSSCEACGFVDSIAYYFRVDLRTGDWVDTRRRPVKSDLDRWVRDSLRAVTATPDAPTLVYGAMFRGRGGGEGDGVGYLLRRSEAGRPLYAYGFVAPFRGWHRVFNSVMQNTTLLPPSLTGGAANDSLLTVAVQAGADPVFRSVSGYPLEFAARDTTYSGIGRLAVTAALRPDAAEGLVIGGLPRSRLPLLGGLLALAAVLIGAAIIQIRRENELARLRADFVSGVSHELRTPLAQIRMFAETLRLGRVRSEAERQRSVEIIDQEAKRLTHLVDNVLLFSRADRQASRLSPEPTELGPVVEDVTEMFGPLAAAKQVEVEAELEPGLVANVDRDAIAQVLLNLLDNAVKYGPAGQTVSVGLRRTNGDARLWVDDEGPGVPVRDRERVFQAFSRLEREAASAIAGSGIGLSVVRELVELHGGRAWIEDAPAGGARCVVALPCSGRRSGDGAASTDGDDARAGTPAPGTPGSAGPGADPDGSDRSESAEGIVA